MSKKKETNKVVVYGENQLASLAHFYLTHDSEYEVVAFTVDEAYKSTASFESKPLVSFESIVNQFSPEEFKMFLPISFKRMSYLRREKYELAKKKGYELISYVSSKATTWPDLNIGDNCFIFEDNTIQPYVEIGNNCVLWSGNHIGHHTVIKDHVFITSQVVISGSCVIEDHAFLGVNSTIRDETIIREASLIGMGANIVKDTQPQDVYLGAKPIKYNKKSLDLDSLSHKSKG